MSDTLYHNVPGSTTYTGESHKGTLSKTQTPYPMDKAAVKFEVPDLKAHLNVADQQLKSHAKGKLLLIARQIKMLQEQAKEIIETAQKDALLHRAECNLVKKKGCVYHLYERSNGTSFFSLISPSEWKCKHTYVGSYKLNADHSFVDVNDLAKGNQMEEEEALLEKLLDTSMTSALEWK
eukprot:Nk52_evm57s208 gene=Nk52_evmTU57s208